MKNLLVQYLKYLKNISILILSILLVSCAWFHKSKKITLQQVKPAPRLVMPQHLDKSKIEDYYPVPNLPQTTTQPTKQPPSLEPQV